MSSADIGILGLGVMGHNLALNLAGHGFSVVAFDPDEHARERARGDGLNAVASMAGLAGALRTGPRTVLLSVPAGEAVDAALGELSELLEAGDIVIDSGNSHFRDTERRTRDLARKDIRFAGIGVSGGAHGALHGPSIMAGAEASAFDHIAPMLNAIAADFKGEPCCAWMGPGGAGHYVKMVHNGIEYAIMQLIAETWLVLRDVHGLDPKAAARVFADWNKGHLASYLVEITAEVLAMTDRASDRPVVEIIADVAGHKGTGRWTSMATIEAGVAAPTIIAAVNARALSSATQARLAMNGSDRIVAAHGGGSGGDIDDLGKALLCAQVCAYAQGFMLLDSARRDHGWPFELERVAAIWRAGCIIRAWLLEPVMATARNGLGPAGLLATEPTRSMIAEALPGLRATVLAGIAHGVPMPAFTSVMSWVDGFRSANVGASLIQAQRDRFGSHGFERIDRPGQHHLDLKGC
ncbi:MAG: NADP-dependent phosphogluconate dehydrogenase [Geminicoccaceae bacterium]